MHVAPFKRGKRYASSSFAGLRLKLFLIAARGAGFGILTDHPHEKHLFSVEKIRALFKPRRVSSFISTALIVRTRLSPVPRQRSRGVLASERATDPPVSHGNVSIGSSFSPSETRSCLFGIFLRSNRARGFVSFQARKSVLSHDSRNGETSVCQDASGFF